MAATVDPHSVLRAVSAIDVATADGGQCADLLRRCKSLRGYLDALEASITSRLRSLTVPAVDIHTRCGAVSASEAQRKQRRAETIERAPSLGSALASGTIGAEHVDALGNATTTLAAPTRDALLSDHAALAATAATMSPERFARYCRDRARLLDADNGLSRDRQQRRDTFLTRRLNAATGMIEGRFAFHPLLGNQVFNAVDAEVSAAIKSGERSGDPDCIDRTVDRPRLAAEALATLIAAGHGVARPLVADITVIIDHETLTTGQLRSASTCETGEAAPLAPAVVQGLLCNAIVTPIVVVAGVPLDAGRTIRHANRTQRRALRAIYSTCAIPGCETPFGQCEIHHIVPWELGGATDLGNLIPTCSRHHHLIHDQRWQLDLAPDRTLTVTRPGRAQIRSDTSRDTSRDTNRDGAWAA